MILALIRGAVDGWYPYPFINVTATGSAQSLVNVVAMTAAFVVAGLVIVALDKVAARVGVRPLAAA